ncbi:hypothetical protein CCR75_004445 [Bremia lactucae]|uniref:Farnesoic acid O-methyl transferase domain-containing protein n=1 Tax=Bremia lactucae TaxID=4779 RepID=A0A976IHL5_BRELC|nr:hypothetical protein CCR75_004445 [Bremia lactucae]
MDASPPTELQLGAAYGRYLHWRSPSSPPAESAAGDANIKPFLASLCALVVQFEATAREDLRVGFAPAIDDMNDAAGTGRPKKPNFEWKYEVAVGMSGNTELVWRKSASGRHKEVDLARVFTGRACSVQEFVPYWAVVNLKSGSMSFGIGKQVGQDVLSTIQDSDFVRVTYIAFTTWDSPVSIRSIQVDGVYDGQTEALEATDVAAYPLPRPIIRADPLGEQDLLSPEQRQQYEAECEVSKRRAERFKAPFAPPDIKNYLDSRDVRKLQRTGAIVARFRTGIDITSQEEQMKRQERMKRFDTPQFASNYTSETVKALEEGMTQDEWVEQQHDQHKLRARAQKFGLSAEEDRTQTVIASLKPASEKVRRERCDVKTMASGGTVLIRDDALHMYSLDDDFQQVRTTDVKRYFTGFAPAYIEWFNDSSCTIVFNDTFTAERALVALAQEITPQKRKDAKTEALNAVGEDVDMVDVEEPAHDPVIAMKDREETIDVLDVEFNRSHWFLGTPISSSQLQTRSKKWRVLLRRATDDDFPPEKIPKKGMYHARSSQIQDSRNSRRRADPEHKSSSRRRGANSRAHPYGDFREDRRGEEPSGSRLRRDEKKTDRNTGKASNRIHVNADGSINIVRNSQAASTGFAKEILVNKKSEPHLAGA